MDPITAFLNVTIAALELMGKMIDGQTPEQKAQLWQWFIDDQRRWRKLLHLDDGDVLIASPTAGSKLLG